MFRISTDKHETWKLTYHTFGFIRFEKYKCNTFEPDVENRTSRKEMLLSMLELRLCSICKQHTLKQIPRTKRAKH